MPVNRMTASQRFRHTSSFIKIGSLANEYSPSIASITTDNVHFPDRRCDIMVQENANRKLVNEIVDKIFDDKSGFYDVSSSACSSLGKQSSKHSFDKRLKYWKNILAERQEFTQAIKKKTGKHSNAVLFNRLTTVDDRDKQTVKRIMDYADRMNPITLMTRKRLRLREYIDPHTCITINELGETVPKAERDRSVKLEISGLPAVAKQEQLGTETEQGTEKKHQWTRSKVLERRIEDLREDIERVIEYYPDIENLQIVGESLQRSLVVKHDSNIKLLHEDPILPISSDTSLCDEAVAQLNAEVEAEKRAEEPPEYGVKINEQVFVMGTKRSSKNVEIKTSFVCEPYQKVVKRILRLENIGQKILNFEWAHRPYYLKSSHLLKANDIEFLFNHKPFRLLPNEARDIIVQFQPRKVDIVKEKWLIKIDPQFFCRRMDGVVIKFHGWCKPPPEYIDKLVEIEDNILAQSNLKTAKSLTTAIASIVPLIQPYEVLCPYKRLLNDREVFESLNKGYKCDRFHDLEMLKEIYKRVKNPREPDWDLNLESLKVLIIRLKSAEQRALVFAEMIGIVQDMKGQAVYLDEENDAVDPQRDHTRFLYVRGTISRGIGEWEEMAVEMEEVFLKPVIKEYFDILAAEAEFQGNESFLMVNKISAKRHLLKTIRREKSFRDTLYVQTYTHICNVVEDIVSVIESTEII